MPRTREPFSPLPRERVLCTACPAPFSLARLRGERYVLTDLRLVMYSRRGSCELPLDGIRRLEVRRSVFNRCLGRSALVARGRQAAHAGVLELSSLSNVQVLTLAFQLLAGDAGRIETDPSLISGAVAASNDPRRGRRRPLIAAAAAAATVMLVVAIRLQGTELPIFYPDEDAIYPGGVKRSPDEIVAFMERDVMPFARRALGPLVGGADRVRCETCHGADAAARDWRMPGVAELPYPKVREGGLERYGAPADPQVRNAVYADLAQDDTQAAAAYMRQVVMPGMARLLGRPAYDFTRSYRYNRSRFALGCYHCHRVN